MFDGAAFCPQVRRRARAHGRGGRRGARVPGVPQRAAAVAIGSTPLLECAGCDGVWVDADVFERLCAERESQAAVLHRLDHADRGATAAGPCATGRASAAER